MARTKSSAGEERRNVFSRVSSECLARFASSLSAMFSIPRKSSPQYPARKSSKRRKNPEREREREKERESPFFAEDTLRT